MSAPLPKNDHAPQLAVDHVTPRQGLLARIRTASKCPARPTTSDMLWCALGSLLGLGIVSFLSFHYHLPLLVAPFGATAALIYGSCTSPFAQPRNVLGGHVISAFVGVLVYQLMGTTWLSVTLGVILAILLMFLTRMVHPPGGATALTAILTGQGFMFILEPVLLGTVVLLGVALLVHRCRGGGCYPTYWF
ncbi:CBS-domain-containing membrane protein [Desulfofundulus luciae]|uniref:CBS-domain-containing membrane protein n=1 Tax=Desulfofundulus luciae TaxID=74702 RepID=A0ABU0B2E8_9FIRM|nr:CBS-domain-containing membrane protein [Desulfofundulus luciae]